MWGRARGTHRRAGAAASTAALVAALALAGCSSDTPAAEPSTGTPATSGATATGAAPTQSERTDVDYVGDGRPEHRLDVFLPPNATGPVPTVVWVHGGGWAAGDKSDIGKPDLRMNEVKDLMLQRGYAVAAPNYRLLPDTHFPEPMQDVAAAVRHLKAHAGEYGLDASRFALMGDSAGAHLAAMTAMTPDHPDLQGDLGGGGDAKVKAFVGYYGLYDLRTRTRDQKAVCGGGKPGAESSHGRLIGADPDTPDGQKVAAAASPVTYVKADSPAVLLFSGRKDCTAPYPQAEGLDRALAAAGVPHELTLIDAPHADPQFFGDPKLTEQLVRFLDAHVKG